MAAALCATSAAVAPARLQVAERAAKPSPSVSARKSDVSALTSVTRRSVQFNRRAVFVRAAAQQTEAEAETYEVELEKPLGIKFARGRDGGAYVIGINPGKGNVSDAIQVGDKIVKVSASFGADIWDALNYGQVMYAIRTRNGNVYMRLEKRYGDMTALEPEEMDEVERLMKEERGGGNYGAGTKEMQQRNYVKTKEAERARRELFDDALAKFKKGEVEAALIDFENVVGLEPKNYLGDNFSRVTTIYRVAQYNMACCYSALDQEVAGLEALDAAMSAGFEDYKKIRTDPNLANLRKSKKFLPLVERYDEPVINREAIEALKNIFSFGKKN